MVDMNSDVAYVEYKDIDNNNEINVNGEMFKYDYESNPLHVEEKDLYADCQEIIAPLSFVVDKIQFGIYFEQRPDVKMIFDVTTKEIMQDINDYKELLVHYEIMKCCVKYSDKEEYKVRYESLLSEKERLEQEILMLKERINRFVSDIYDYNNIIEKLKILKFDIHEFERNNSNLMDEDYYIEKLQKISSTADISYYVGLRDKAQAYNSMLKQKEIYEEKINYYICSAITLDDVSEQLHGYDSIWGVVPAGEWDTHKNVNYQGEGYETGMLGSFEGPQGKETGYDSRKGDYKTNYKDPDRSLLEFLSMVEDANGKILYPASSFEKGGEYYYHIFGVNDDGTINWNLVNNPRFGCKMLGDYLLVGCDQQFNRERGSKVITSLGPAIVFDYGIIDDLETDPSHIDISMDEVLFWLKDFSHNEGRYVRTLAGIYDWCTTDSYRGTVDFNYEHMERYYVNNLNVLYGANFVCIFDRDDFENETTFETQEEFVYKLTY